ncbi:cyclopropane-fatty-acyl-phospholipid synthase [Seminavis robusta]|uniref:Cyclopropane-fatty-acyl-phospholipid synthase n=1 Tax=Seminavis robusta TaxID=568900 RepID=A0A9N8DKH5_9STRA|nr:cyclopropane-fatty-acyl-phospholipid synthase [Seminavis robusta]|eukprot:Sro133_g062910.1 cyclopropane-fatty-acyl-phospholipid synthase (380) ;mRNA; r:21667-22894
MGATEQKPNWSELVFLWQPWNSCLNLATWAASLCLAMTLTGSAATVLAFYLVFIVIYDILYYGYKFSIIDENGTLRQGYNLSYLIDDAGSALGGGLDYGFNYYNGNFKKDRIQAQQDKFDFCYQQLGLQAGMTVIDCGCGCGDWLNYLRTRGVTGIGINITPAQVKVCRERGLTVLLTDWKLIGGNAEFEKQLYGKADAVTCWDTIEHYVPSKCRTSVAQQDAIYTQLFQLIQKFLSPDSKVGRTWTSCLHYGSIGKSHWMTRSYNDYLLDKFHSGCYPDYSTRQLTQNAKRAKFTQIMEKNLTEDYYMTSVLCPNHFGRHKHTLTFYRAVALSLVVLLDPNWLQRFLWMNQEAWMDQFDAKKLEDSPMQLLWIMWERN